MDKIFERNCLAINKLIDKILKLYNVKQATELGKKVEQDFFVKKIIISGSLDLYLLQKRMVLFLSMDRQTSEALQYSPNI